MAKTSYFGGPSSPELGSKPPIHKQPIPGYDQRNYRLVMTEEEKEEDDFYSMKTLVYNYERIGRQYLTPLREGILKKFNLAYGIIDQGDYIKGKSEYEMELSMMDDVDLEFDLKFYPIIPNIVNTLTNYLSKIKVEYTAQAVNPEAQNEIIEQKNEQIRNLLISKAKELFDFHMEEQGVTQESQPDVYKQQLDIFMALPKIQQYYSTDLRLDIVTGKQHGRAHV